MTKEKLKIYRGWAQTHTAPTHIAFSHSDPPCPPHCTPTNTLWSLKYLDTQNFIHFKRKEELNFLFPRRKWHWVPGVLLKLLPTLLLELWNVAQHAGMLRGVGHSKQKLERLDRSGAIGQTAWTAQKRLLWNTQPEFILPSITFPLPSP